MIPALIKSVLVASGGIVSVGQVLLTLLLLGSERGLRKALAYATGMNLALLVVGQAVLLWGTRAAEGPEKAGPSLTAVVFSFALATLLFFVAFRTWRKPAAKNPEPPKFFGTLDRAQPAKLFGLGVLVGVINFKNMALFLAAVDIIVDARLPPQNGAVLVLVVTLVLTSCITGPIAIFIVGRRSAEPLLKKMREALTRHQRRVMLIVLPVFATGFFLRGISLALAYREASGG